MPKNYLTNWILSHESAGSGGFIFPDRREFLRPLVVTGQAVNPALHQDQPEFGVLVLSVPLQVLPDRHRLLN